jgi:DNA adenine methylase
LGVEVKYMGSKARHAKELLPIILADRKPGQWYVEPFVGGANMIDKVDGNRIGSDTHPNLIALWQAVSNGWLPPTNVSESEYAAAKKMGAFAYTGFVGFGCSYSGKWFGGYARGNDANGNPRNYAAESARNIEKQSCNLRGVVFFNKSYTELEIPQESIIYCDPPYAGTTKYATEDFDHEAFWRWCEQKSAQGHTVFVSEYAAPNGWECVWEKRVNNTLTKDTGSKQGVERLFRFRPC